MNTVDADILLTGEHANDARNASQDLNTEKGCYIQCQHKFGSCRIRFRIFVLLATMFMISFCILFSFKPDTHGEEIHHRSKMLNKETRYAPNIALCIVGQLQSLEVPSKLLNLLQVNPEFNIHVLAILQRGEAEFSKIRGSSKCYVDTPENDFTERLTNLFILYGARSMKVKIQDREDWIGTKEMVRRAIIRSFSLRMVQNSLNALLHDQLCAREVHILEEEGKHIDLIIRVRDNSVFEQPLRIFSLNPFLANPSVLLRRCMSNGGYNDKFWIIPRNLLDNVLLKPQQDVFNGLEYLQKQPRRVVSNTEYLTKKMWDHYGVPVTRLSAKELPVVDARCRSNGTADLLGNFPMFYRRSPAFYCNEDKFSYEEILNRMRPPKKKTVHTFRDAFVNKNDIDPGQ